MKSIFRLLPLLAVATLSLSAQTAVAPWLPQQFLNNAGQPLADGLVYSCAAGSSCPGNPLDTYTSSNGLAKNPNPIVLNGGGFAPSGIWLTPNTGYKFVIATAQGATVYTIDNVFGALTIAPSSVTPGLPLNSLQYNCGPGNLCGSSNLLWDPGNQVLSVTGTSGQSAVNVLSGYLTAYGGVVSAVQNGGSWNGFNSNTDGANLRGYVVSQTNVNTSGGYVDFSGITYNPYLGAQCLDQWGNLVQQPLPLNGYSGFPTTDIILWATTSPSMPSNGSCGAPLPVSPVLTVDGVPNQQWGLATNGYFFPRGGLATDNPAFNSIQSLLGGMYAKLGFTSDQAFYLKTNGAPNTPAANYGGIAYAGAAVGSGLTYEFYNASSGSWTNVNLASGGGGGGGSPGSPNDSIQTNSGGVFTGYSWLTVNTSGQYVVSNGGYQTPASGSGGCTAFNCFDSISGGMHAGLGFTADQAFYPKGYASSASLNTPASGYGGLAYAGSTIGTGATYYYYNAATPGWASVDLSTSGSGCTLGGTASGQVIFNLSSACASSTNLQWNNSTAQLTVGGGTSTTQSIIISNGYGLANAGWNAGTCSASTCIQAPSGGLKAGLGVTANQAFYPLGYSSASSLNPPAAGYGGIGYAGSGLNYWFWNGTNSTWNQINLSSSGGGGAAGPQYAVQVNNGSGGFTASTNFTFNTATNVANIGGSLNILGSPSINTSNQFVGSAVNVSGAVQSQSTGASVAFQNANNLFSVTGSGVENIQSITVAGGSGNGVNITSNTAANSFQTVGGFSSLNGSSTNSFQNSNGSFQVNGLGAMTVGAVTSNSTIQSTLGSGVAFQAGSGAFQAYANGNINGLNINALTSLQINGTTVVNSSGVFVSGGGINTSGGGSFGAGGVVTSGGGIFASGVTFNGGIATNAATNSNIYIGSGNLYVRYPGASSGISCSGITNGWIAITSDNYVVWCGNGGTRYRATGVSF